MFNGHKILSQIGRKNKWIRWLSLCTYKKLECGWESFFVCMKLKNKWWEVDVQGFFSTIESETDIRKLVV